MSAQPSQKDIEAVDEQLLELLNRRAALAVQFGKAIDAGDDLQPGAQNDHVLEQIRRWTNGVLSQQQLLEVFRPIQSVCESLLHSQPPRVACLGPPGSFTQLAACRWFGTSGKYELLANIDEVFRALASRMADRAVVAVSNSYAGPVQENLDLLAEHVGQRFPFEQPPEFSITSALSLKIEYCLFAKGTIDQIKAICSHPQGLEQCRTQIQAFQAETGLRDLGLIPETSTSEAARRAASDPSVAAIANRLAGHIWDLKVIRERMEDVPDNSTRFLLIGRRPLPLTSDCRTLLWFRCAHQPGALAGALQPLSKAGLNMTMVVSRPVRRESWAYSFFVEAEGHMDDPRMRGAIENMHGACLPRELKVLGSYELSRGY